MLIGEHTQERRLPQGNVERRFERVVEDRIARLVVEVGEDDCVLVGQALALLVRAIVKPTCYKQSDQQNGNRNLPELSPPSRHSVRACRRSAPTLGIPLQPLQIRSHVGCVLVPEVAVFLQGLIDDSLKIRRQVGIQSQRRDRGAVQDSLGNHRRRLAPKRQRARRHLVQHSTEGEQIAPPIQLFRPNLLRRHISHRTDHRARTGQMLGIHRFRLRVESGDLARRTGCRTDFRQSKVENLCMPTLGDKNVRRFDVAVDDAL